MSYPPCLSRIAAGVVAVSLLSLSGCLMGSTASQTRSGNYVSSSNFSRLRPGETTTSYATALLGNPDLTVPQDDESQIWRYAYTETTRSSGYVFLIFGGSSKKETHHTVYLHFKDDKLIKAWRD